MNTLEEILWAARPVSDKLVIAKAKIEHQGQMIFVRITLMEPAELKKILRADGTEGLTYNGDLLIERVKDEDTK